MNYQRVLMAVAVCTTLSGIQAQEMPSPRSGESRLPKGIQGLEAGQAQPPSANWLLNAKDDQERFRRIQIFSGGTYEQMWQIGYRYQQVYHAIIDENWELGAYHWTKLRDVLNIALMKRPNRTPNAEAIFLDAAWQRLDAALKTKDPTQARQAFLTERSTCMACHAAENLPWLNNTPIFRDTESFPDN